MHKSLKVKHAVSEVLSRPDLNGIYRVSQAGFGFHPVIDGRTLRTKSALLAGLARVFDFPAYFGENWDALEECLRDMSWCEGPISVLIDHADAVPRDLLDMLLDVFATSTLAWSREGRACSLLLCGLDEAEICLLA